MYVALAEALDAVLLTADRRLAAANGPMCRIEVIAAP
jgi:predicted nucleic acid-binding protein